MKPFSHSVALALAALAFAAPAKAQVTYDMSKATCIDYAVMAPEMKRDFAAWMSGWFNQKQQQTEINLQILRANVATMETWCQRNPQSRVMALIEEAARNARDVPGGPASLAIAKVSCGDYLGSEAELQFLLTAWIGGYVASERGQPKIDVKSFAVTERATNKACAKNKKALLLPTVKAQIKG